MLNTTSGFFYGYLQYKFKVCLVRVSTRKSVIETADFFLCPGFKKSNSPGIKLGCLLHIDHMPAVFYHK